MAERAVTNSDSSLHLCKIGLSMSEEGHPKKSRRHRSATLLACAALVLIAEIGSPAASHAGELNPHDMVLLDRLTWGINASSAAHLQAVPTEPPLQHPLPSRPLPPFPHPLR